MRSWKHASPSFSNILRLEKEGEEPEVRTSKKRKPWACEVAERKFDPRPDLAEAEKAKAAAALRSLSDLALAAAAASDKAAAAVAEVLPGRASRSL